jgi:hypothetical protein
MGYYSTVTGRIAIRPPLPWSAIRDSRFLPDRAEANYLEVQYEVAETVEETGDGTVSRKQAMAVVPSFEDSYKAYDLADTLAEINTEIVAAGSLLWGYLVRKGEEQGDVERYGIQNGTTDTVSTEKARLSWPDGTAVEE